MAVAPDPAAAPGPEGAVSRGTYPARPTRLIPG